VTKPSARVIFIEYRIDEKEIKKRGEGRKTGSRGQEMEESEA